MSTRISPETRAQQLLAAQPCERMTHDFSTLQLYIISAEAQLEDDPSLTDIAQRRDDDVQVLRIIHQRCGPTYEAKLAAADIENPKPQSRVQAWQAFKTKYEITDL